jgi:transcription initiation factor TFIIIB Brf1 subunit/transcription initiation factor TFIIB
MAVVPNNKIQVNNSGQVDREQDVQIVCGTCGCVVAAEHTAKHIAWHANAAWPQATVTTSLPADWT